MQKWIRADLPATENEYHEFLDFFETNSRSAWLKISSETDYCVYLNGARVGFGQYHDLETYKVYDELDLSPFTVKGRNVLAITAYFEHTSTSNYVEKGLGLSYCVTADGKVLCESDENTLSRLSRAYESGTGVPLITGQLGYSYRYDFRAEDDWKSGKTDGFAPSRAIDKTVALYPRPIEKLTESKNTARVIRTGRWSFVGGESTAAQAMQNAVIEETAADAVLPRADGYTLDCGGNGYLLVDLGEEKTGVLTFDIETEKPCAMYVAYGEHIADGRVRSYISGRNFSLEFNLRAGRNAFTGTFRRLGARYISLFVQSPEVKIYDFNLISTDYPVRVKKRIFPDSRLQKIYDVSVNTLRVCMHEHYEDTPWREQALYAMDGRNQMLCGYTAFGNYRFARASLKLLSENLRDDGFFTLTSPKSKNLNELTIPNFSLIQFVAMDEYATYSGDSSLFSEYESNYRAVMENFISLREKNGLIKAVKGIYHWNFSEWAEGLDGNFLCEPHDLYEAPLNAFFILALRGFVNLLKSVGGYRGEYDRVLRETEQAFLKFYDKKKKCWADFMADDGTLSRYSELTNSLAVLAVKDDALRRETAKILAKRPDFTSRITLSNSIFKYSALLSVDGKAYRESVLKEIAETWGAMLDEGATTFYEDEAGEKAFNRAGSLSHGWSAVPVYVLTKIFYPEEIRERNL